MVYKKMSVSHITYETVLTIHVGEGNFRNAWVKAISTLVNDSYKQSLTLNPNPSMSLRSFSTSFPLRFYILNVLEKVVNVDNIGRIQVGSSGDLSGNYTKCVVGVPVDIVAAATSASGILLLSLRHRTGRMIGWCQLCIATWHNPSSTNFS